MCCPNLHLDCLRFTTPSPAMKLTLALLALLPHTICFANTHNPNFNADEEESHHPLDFQFELLKAKQTLNYLDLNRDEALLQSRAQNPSSTPPQQDQPFDSTPPFLPPPWSPDSNLDSPYPPSGVSPTDDSGRAEVLDNEPSVQEIWRQCPLNTLDCRKCPRDSRCRRPDTPWWQLDPTIQIDPAKPNPWLPSAEANGWGVCPLSTCGTAKCGKNARCVNFHCVCNRGLKGALKFGSVLRGFDGLQAVTVWVNSGMDCDVPCESLSCSEVVQVGACFGKVEAPSGEYAGTDYLETADIRGGAIHVPGPYKGSIM